MIRNNNLLSTLYKNKDAPLRYLKIINNNICNRLNTDIDENKL